MWGTLTRSVKNREPKYRTTDRMVVGDGIELIRRSKVRCGSSAIFNRNEIPRKEKSGSKGALFYLQPSKSWLRGTLAVELGVAVWRRVDVSLYACRKRCPQAEARETRGWHGRRVERITNMTSILRQARGRSNHRRLGSTIPGSPSPAILTPHTPPRTLNFDFIKLQEHLQPGGNACIMLHGEAGIL